MTSTLQLLDSGVNSYVTQVLRLLIDNIPPEANFAQIESLLPPLNSETSSHEIEKGRLRLLVKWARSDPAAAANFVMENPERADANAIRQITHAVLETNYHGGLEWIEYFPAGPYLDAAARAAVMRTYRSSPEVAQRYASMIENEKLREQSMKEIENVLIGRRLPPERED